MDKRAISGILAKIGGRNTTLKEALVALFLNTKKPLSVPEILDMLDRLGSSVNKTSVYRQIQMFVTAGVIRELQLDKDMLHYELADLEHHHHLICQECHKIEHIEVKHIEEHISNMEKETREESGFHVHSHMLEFYGLCKKCSPLS